MFGKKLKQLFGDGFRLQGLPGMPWNAADRLT